MKIIIIKIKKIIKLLTLTKKKIIIKYIQITKYK